MHHHGKIGGLNRTFTTIEELIEELTEEDISNLLSWYPFKSTIQRTGYLLEELQADNKLTDLFYEYLKDKRYFPILLSPTKGQKAGKVSNVWKVDVNLELESDL